MSSEMKPTRAFYTTLTEVVIGGPSKLETFTVHTEVLKSCSGFFACALSHSSPFVEASTNKVTLEEVDPRIFSFWVQWAYTRSLNHEEIDWVDPPMPLLDGSERFDSNDAGSRTSTPGIGTHDEEHDREGNSTNTTSDFLSAGTHDAVNTGEAVHATSPVDLEKPDATRPSPAFFYLIRLYKLASFLNCELLRNQIINEVARVARKRNAVPSPSDSWELMGDDLGDGPIANATFYGTDRNINQSPAHSGLRDLVYDLFIGMRTANLLKSSQQWEPVWMRDLFLRMKDREDDRIPGVSMVEPYKDEKLICLTYHQHRETGKCVRWIGDV